LKHSTVPKLFIPYWLRTKCNFHLNKLTTWIGLIRTFCFCMK